MIWCLLALVTANPFLHVSAAVIQPKADPFYRSPIRIDEVANGTILRSRVVDVSVASAPLGSVRSTAYQLLYRTEDNSNKSIANVATVIVPQNAPPRGARTLISLQDAEDSLDWNCAPSYQLRVGENAPTGEQDDNLVAELASVLPDLITGRVLVIPDVEGPTSDYVVRRSNAHMVLDAIRAAERFGPAGLGGHSTPVGLVGYSGGGWETAAANELQPTYAPELNIVGAAAGGVPVANIANVRYIDGGVATGVLMAVGDAVAHAYNKEKILTSALNTAGRAFLTSVRTGCASSVFAAPLAHFDQWTTRPNFFARADVMRILTDNQLGHAAPRAPSFYYNGVHDEIIWVEPLDQLLAEYCAAGSSILYVRDQAGLEHIQGAGTFFALARAYLEARFAGAPVPTSCGVSAYNSIPPD